MSCPSSTEPLPSGKPVPSALTSMSQPAISAGVAALPKSKCRSRGSFGAPAAMHAIAANAANKQFARNSLRCDLNIADFAACRDAPGLDGIVMVDRARAAHLAQLAVGRLHVTRFVDHPRLQQRRAAVPVPVEPEARQRL